MNKITVFIIPSQIKNNPYLELLYKGVEKNNNEDTEFTIKPFTVRASLARVFSGKKSIVHIHWETNVYGSKYFLHSLCKLVTSFIYFFFLRYICRVRFVWTMHNARAHDYPHPHIDRVGRTLMLKLSHVVIIQNKQASISFSNEHPSARVTYIPHGNYCGVYGPLELDRSRARNSLNLSDDSAVLLSLGAIRPYKNLEMLIDLVQSVSVRISGPKSLLLLIAGKGEPEYIKKLETLSNGFAHIRIISEFIPDDKIPEFYAASDYAVFAHGSSSLTSGSLLLALSYGAPVITLPMPAAEILVEGVTGYVPLDTTALGLLLSTLCDSSTPMLDRMSILKSVSDLSWDRVGAETRALYLMII